MQVRDEERRDGEEEVEVEKVKVRRRKRENLEIIVRRDRERKNINKWRGERRNLWIFGMVYLIKFARNYVIYV